MDDGQVIPGLNENWTFGGAKPMEWVSGLCAAIIFQELFITNLGRSMPLVLMVLVSVPIGLATLRKTYPDEERGVRNYIMSLMGVSPPDIPRPAILQPIWSGAPTQKLRPNCLYNQLQLAELFERKDDEQEKNERFYH